MVKSSFSHVQTWVFDLDNTLYPPSANLFEQIEALMAAYVMQELGLNEARAHSLRAQYWHRYGTTLAGLMAEHDIAPDPFLEAVHDIDFTVLTPAPDLAETIAALPGRKIIYTNGTAPYARNVIAARGLSGIFDAIYGVEHANYRPKPEHAAFDTVFARDALDPARAAMFEDDPRNLAVPHALGMQTVHVAPAPLAQPHIHHHTDDLTGFLSQLL